MGLPYYTISGLGLIESMDELKGGCNHFRLEGGLEKLFQFLVLVV